MFALKFETEKATPILDGLFGWNEWETNIEYGLGSWYKPLEGSWFPLRRVFLVVESLTRKNWEWNSINNLLSVVNLKTLSKFFLIFWTHKRFLRNSGLSKEWKPVWPKWVTVKPCPLPTIILFAPVYWIDMVKLCKLSVIWLEAPKTGYQVMRTWLVAWFSVVFVKWLVVVGP